MNNPHKRMATAAARFIRQIRANQTGVAAVEFALILPLMLTIYLGSAEITQALMASRKATLVSHTLADLTSQQPNGVNIADSDLTEIFGAATAIMAPFSPTPLRMTITSVNFVPDSGSPTGYDAKPQWTATQNGGTPRPCAVLTPVSDTATPSSTTLPTGVYASGSIIVADVVYTYMPPFGSSFFQSQGMLSLVTYAHTSYMRPREWLSYIQYGPGSMAQICPSY